MAPASDDLELGIRKRVAFEIKEICLCCYLSTLAQTDDWPSQELAAGVSVSRCHHLHVKATCFL